MLKKEAMNTGDTLDEGLPPKMTVGALRHQLEKYPNQAEIVIKLEDTDELPLRIMGIPEVDRVSEGDPDKADRVVIPTLPAHLNPVVARDLDPARLMMEEERFWEINAKAYRERYEDIPQGLKEAFKDLTYTECEQFENRFCQLYGALNNDDVAELCEKATHYLSDDHFDDFINGVIIKGRAAYYKILKYADIEHVLEIWDNPVRDICYECYHSDIWKAKRGKK